MQDLWRLSAAELASLIKTKKVSAKEAATSALARLDAVNPKINAVVDHKPAEVLAQAAAIDAAIGRGEDVGPLGGVPITVKVNIDQTGLCHHQRPEAAARGHRDDQQPRDRQSVQGRRRHFGAHQLPGVLLSLVHHQPRAWRHQKPPRSRHHAGRLVRRRGRCGRGRHRAYRPRHRHRGIDPLPGLCLRRPWPAADDGPDSGVQRRTAGAHHRSRRSAPCQARWRGRLAISGSRWRRCRRGTIAIPGGCRRRWKARQCQSASRCASIRMASIPCRR